ncbi:UNVERIFIED_CONTAM: uhrf1 [Trichonephila clavipes]
MITNIANSGIKMWIQVRTMDGKISHRIDGLSKLTKIEDLRNMLAEKFKIPANQQRLFYRGKQLEDGHNLFDYSVGLNDIVQMLIKEVDLDLVKTSPSPKPLAEKVNKENKSEPLKNAAVSQTQSLSRYFKIGDLIDAKDPTNGAWFEAKILDIKSVINNDKQVLQSQKLND